MRINIRKKLFYYIDWFINCINIPYHISNHLIGKNHTPTHRKVVGVLIMVFGGSFVSIIGTIFHFLSAHIIADVIGNSIHGIGLIPFIKDIENKVEQTTEKSFLNH